MPTHADPSDQPAEAVDAEVAALLVEFGGDWRAAIIALLHDLDVLAGDYEGAVSRGYVRGRPMRAGRPPKARSGR